MARLDTRVSINKKLIMLKVKPTEGTESIQVPIKGGAMFIVTRAFSATKWSFNSRDDGREWRGFFAVFHDVILFCFLAYIFTIIQDCENKWHNTPLI